MWSGSSIAAVDDKAVGTMRVWHFETACDPKRLTVWRCSTCGVAQLCILEVLCPSPHTSVERHGKQLSFQHANAPCSFKIWNPQAKIRYVRKGERPNLQCLGFGLAGTIAPPVVV
ncbi:unnamed protein product [Ostreobium quekettii]|uniref:Uncharacterized protein n=1 Tax=Ostreobium quekettii TaxID=121088 RepID=A0A8S1JCI4_9CHLO|nr:unnamed protein product [Ostreobium quekettii]